jgi:hypothetical protein
MPAPSPWAWRNGWTSYQELGPDYYRPRSPARLTQAKIREIERLNPGKKVILAPADRQPETLSAA